MQVEEKALSEEIITHLKKVRRASRRIPRLSGADNSDILNQLADEALRQTPYLLQENRKDLDRMDPADPKYDRLMLTEKRLEGIAADLRNVAGLPSPLGHILEERTLPNALQLQKVSVPIGVIGIVYESRPNVTFDVFALCLKSGNASVLKGSRDAHFSNIAIVGIIQDILAGYDLNDIVFLAPSRREALGPILQADEYIDLIIPRGGKGLIDFVRQNARVPVIETGAGIVHTYFDRSADLEKGRRIIENAKTRRVSVCNALDTLVIHADRLEDLPELLKTMGRSYGVTVYADEEAFPALEGKYPKGLLHKAEEKHFGTEFLSLKMSVKVVPDIDAAIDHISEYSSRHSEAIIAEDAAAVDHFLKNVDAAVVYANTSTAFTDGAQFGLGAEIGISTQKLHARGPMALRELTSYKWLVRGTGQVRGAS